MRDDILVIKIGGSAGVDTNGILQDVATIAHNRPVVVVHGVSARMARLSAERGLAVEMLQSPSGHRSRYTPPHVRDLFVEAATQVNQEIIAGLQDLGCAASGFTDQLVIRGERKTAIRSVVNGRIRVIHDDHTGRITNVDASPLITTLSRATIAVVPPLAISSDGPLNIDGDRAAAAIAGALSAESLVILSNVRGLYRNFPDESSFVDHIRAPQINEAMHWAQGRMKRKVLGVQTALEGGVQRVIIGDGRNNQPVSRAMAGEGTVFT